jgi:hypothetical protein
LNKLWLGRLIEILIANPSKLRGDLQRLDYDLGDMNTLTLNIKEDIKFQRGINVKVNPGKIC